jgi:hypothetical protein
MMTASRAESTAQKPRFQISTSYARGNEKFRKKLSFYKYPSVFRQNREKPTLATARQH